MAGWTGLEPATFCVTGRRSNQLSYHPVRTGKEAERRIREMQVNELFDEFLGCFREANVALRNSLDSQRGSSRRRLRFSCASSKPGSAARAASHSASARTKSPC